MEQIALDKPNKRSLPLVMWVKQRFKEYFSLYSQQDLTLTHRRNFRFVYISHTFKDRYTLAENWIKFRPLRSISIGLLRSRFLLSSGTSVVQQIKAFDWMRKQLLFTSKTYLRSGGNAKRKENKYSLHCTI